MVNALLNNESSFFRDLQVFDMLFRDLLPHLRATLPTRHLRIWCAGCSTGQEAYSLALIGVSAPQLADVKLDILATDISERALEKAAAGLYTQFEVQRGLPIRMLINHFERIDDNWRASPRLRQAVRWGRVNLAGDLSRAGPFDLILCRNVLSSFGSEARAHALAARHRTDQRHRIGQHALVGATVAGLRGGHPHGALPFGLFAGTGGFGGHGGAAIQGWDKATI